MQTYVYFPAGRSIWRILPDELRRKFGLEPTIWMGDDRHLEHARLIYPDAFSYSLTRTLAGDLWHDDHSKHAPLISAEPLRSGLESIQAQAFSMMNRLELVDGVTHLEREFRFWQTASHFLGMLDALEPDALIAAEAPHSFPQFIIHELCRMKNIPTLHFCSSSIAPFLVPRFGIGAGTEVLPAGIDRGNLSPLHSRIEAYFEKFAEKNYGSIEPEYMQRQRAEVQRRHAEKHILASGDARALDGGGVRQPTAIVREPLSNATDSLRSLGVRLSRASKAPQSVLPAVHRRIALRQIRRRRARGLSFLQTSYRREVATSRGVGPFVYFPLHYEPERTTNPEGGSYWSQYKAISTLRAVLPANIALGVREHPSQFNVRMKGSLGRSPDFYRWVRSLQNTFLIATDVDPYPLLTESEFVATVTGSAALEAVAFGRPALVLGHPWFEGVPGSVGLEEVESDEAMAVVQSRFQVENFVHELLDDSGVPGIVNPSNERLYRETAGMDALFDDASGAQTLASTIMALLETQSDR